MTFNRNYLWMIFFRFLMIKWVTKNTECLCPKSPFIYCYVYFFKWLCIILCPLRNWITLFTIELSAFLIRKWVHLIFVSCTYCKFFLHSFSNVETHTTVPITTCTLPCIQMNLFWYILLTHVVNALITERVLLINMSLIVKVTMTTEILMIFECRKVICVAWCWFSRNNQWIACNYLENKCPSSLML